MHYNHGASRTEESSFLAPDESAHFGGAYSERVINWIGLPGEGQHHVIMVID